MKLPLILLIDDEVLVAKSLEMILKAAGFNVLVATSVVEAIEAWDATGEIEMVITDWSLDHQTNGEQLVERFRTEKPNLKRASCAARFRCKSWLRTEPKVLTIFEARK
jgi:DNA-binding NtrC family response regulator